VLYGRVSIAGLAHELPSKVLTSAAIEDRLAPVYGRIGLVPGRIEMMTGIRERRYWPEPVRPSEVAARAGERALEAAKIDRARIGAVIHASVCRDFLEPATANVVHDRLRLPPSAQVFDVSNACLGVLNGMLLAANMIELGQIEAGLVVSGENGKPLVDSTIESLLSRSDVTRKNIKQSFASLTIGSAAVGVVVARADLVPEGHRLLGATVRAATEHHHLCQGGGAGASDTGLAGGGALDMNTDAEALLEAGIALARTNFESFLNELSWTRENITRAITHQVGRAHQRLLFEALSVPEDRSFISYDRLGNVGSASLPVTLALAAEEGFVDKGHDVALLGIGSGLSSIMMGVRW
jgi:acyl-CoA:acyl-CoA alkyltransferase